MNNSQNHVGLTAITRRSVLSGGAAVAVALTAMPSKVFASTSGFIDGAVPFPRRQRPAESTLAKYLCENVHEKIAMQLDVTIADPEIDGEQTALALMEARCPGCGGRVHPKNSSLSAVVPKWKSPMEVGNSGVIA